MNDLGYLFSADPVATEAFFGPTGKQGPIAPEKELMLAVLADAVECFCKYSGSRDGVGTRLFREAHEWIFTEDEEEAFSFRNVCDALNLDPGYVRRGILEWRWRSLGHKWDEKPEPQEAYIKNMKRNVKKISRRRKVAAR